MDSAKAMPGAVKKIFKLAATTEELLATKIIKGNEFRDRSRLIEGDRRGGSRGRVQGVRTPPLPEMTCGFLIQLVFCEKKTMWFIGVEEGQETSAPPPKKNPGSAPGSLKAGPLNTEIEILTRQIVIVLLVCCLLFSLI